MFVERGGSSTLARHAFNELVSFIAGWAILIDYIIVIALAAVSVPHYLSPIWGGFTHGWAEIAVAALVIAFAAAINIAGFTGHVRQRPLIVLALADVVLQLAVIVVGAIVVFHPDLLTAHVDLFTTPVRRAHLRGAGGRDARVRGHRGGLRPGAGPEVASHGTCAAWSARRAVLLPLIYAGMAAIALMAVPVVPGPDGPHTALGERFIEEPVLGVVMSYEPAWLSTVLQVAVVAIAPVVLTWAASTSMLGLSRHVYVLATNRQVPSWLGQARPALDAVRRDLGRGGDRVRRSPSPATCACWRGSTRSAPRWRSRSPTCRSSGCAGPSPIASVRSGCRSTSRSGGRQLPVPAIAGRGADAAAVARGARLPRQRPLGGRRLDAVRPGRLRRLPAVRRADVADQARLGAGGGAAQGGARGRVRGHPGAGLRDRARRRHRQHGGPAGRRRRRAG